MKKDKRVPSFKLVGCYSWNNGQQSFSVKSDFKVQNGQVFVYNKGVLFLLGEGE